MTADPRERLRAGDALLIVDVQRDFCAGGALAVADADAVVPVINAWIEAAAGRGSPVYASRDWHPPGHPSFRERGGPWPAHCLQDRPGAAWHPALALPDGAVVVCKGTRFDRDQYSAFDETGLAERLRTDDVRRLFVAGIALDVCVRASAIDALTAGFAVHLLADATRPVDPESGRRALDELRASGARIENAA